MALGARRGVTARSPGASRSRTRSRLSTLGPTYLTLLSVSYTCTHPHPDHSNVPSNQERLAVTCVDLLYRATPP